MSKDYYIHPSSIIGEEVAIGSGTKIWHFCHVMSKATLGINCVLGQNVFVAGSVSIGNNVKVQNNVSIYAGVSIEDDAFIGPSVVFTNVINPRSQVNRKNEFQQTLIKLGASIGANATIVCGNTIGKWAFIGAGAVVTHDVPDYAIFTGNPARLYGWMSEKGERLQFINNIAQCPLDNTTYKLTHGRVEKVNQ